MNNRSQPQPIDKLTRFTTPLRSSPRSDRSTASGSDQDSKIGRAVWVCTQCSSPIPILQTLIRLYSPNSLCPWKGEYASHGLSGHGLPGRGDHGPAATRKSSWGNPFCTHNLCTRCLPRMHHPRRDMKIRFRISVKSKKCPEKTV